MTKYTEPRNDEANARFYRFMRSLGEEVKRNGIADSFVISKGGLLRDLDLGGDDGGQSGKYLSGTLREGRSCLSKIFGRKLIRLYSFANDVNIRHTEITYFDSRLVPIMESKTKELNNLIEKDYPIKVSHKF